MSMFLDYKSIFLEKIIKKLSTYFSKRQCIQRTLQLRNFASTFIFY